MPRPKTKLNTLLVILSILLGSILLSATTIRSGLQYDFGLGFWGPNGHDAIWHLAVIAQLQKNIPPLNPVFSSQSLTNYHWGFDLVIAVITKVLNLNIISTYFRFFPIIISILIGVLSYKFAYLTTKNQKTATLFVILNYFCGSFGWIITLFRHKEIGGESLFWSMQPASTLLNPPYALSLVLLLSGLILWHQKNQSIKTVWPFIIGLLFGVLSLVKIYGGIIVGLTLTTLCLLEFLKNKKISKYILYTTVFTGLFSIITLVSLGALKDASLLIFKPLWFCHSLVESYDKLYLPGLASFRSNLAGQIFTYKFPVFLAIEFCLFAIFLLGNLGIRILAIFPILKKLPKPQPIDQFLLISMVISLFIPTFFVQKGTAWNTIQFFYYFLFIANYYLALYLSSVKKTAILIGLIILSSVTSYSTLKDYFGYPPPSALPSEENKALTFLKLQTGNIVLTFPYDSYKKNGIKTPIPLYLYETTAYVSAFSSKTTYLEDEMNLNITGYDWQTRRESSLAFFNSKNIFAARGFLVNNNIDYIYLVKDQNLPFNTEELQLDLIYAKDQIKIFKIRK